MYALPITLRYKNQRMFYTNAGAMVSVMIYVAILFVLVNNFGTVWEKNQFTFQESSYLATDADT
jgi:hypothetical protein